MKRAKLNRRTKFRKWWEGLGLVAKTQWIISTTAILLVLVHLLVPWVMVDWVAITLLAIAVAPWLVPIIKSVELPGGLKIELKDLEKLEERARDAGLISESEPRDYDLGFAFLTVADSDPNLALAGLRIEIERQLNRLAEPILKNRRAFGLGRLMHLLHEKDVLTKQQISILSDLIGLLNSAVHGAEVDPESLSWAMDAGPKLVVSLQELSNELELGEP